jgi:hypothetical protein
MKSGKENPSGNASLILKNKIGLKSDQKVVAIWGYPDLDVLTNITADYKDHLVVDLDIPYGAAETKLLPENYCQIITNIIDNAMALKDSIDVIIAATGEEKCDQGRFAAYILEEQGFNVIQTKYLKEKQHIRPALISTSSLPLKEKILLIMDSMIKPELLNNYNLTPCQPSHGFWGVPPNDLGILELFPDTTHVYGWTRTVETRCPASLDEEMYVDDKVPTVFFAQTFCAKMQLAKYLAKKYDGLYVDIDDYMSVSVRAKIEAFLRLT